MKKFKKKLEEDLDFCVSWQHHRNWLLANKVDALQMKEETRFMAVVTKYKLAKLQKMQVLRANLMEVAHQNALRQHAKDTIVRRFEDEAVKDEKVEAAQTADFKKAFEKSVDDLQRIGVLKQAKLNLDSREDRFARENVFKIQIIDEDDDSDYGHEIELMVNRPAELLFEDWRK